MHVRSINAPPGLSPIPQRSPRDPGITEHDAAEQLAAARAAHAAVLGELNEANAAMDAIAGGPLSGADIANFAEAYARKAALAELMDRVTRRLRAAEQAATEAACWAAHVDAEADRKAAAKLAADLWAHPANASRLAFGHITRMRSKDRTRQWPVLRTDVFTATGARTFGKSFMRLGGEGEPEVIATDEAALQAFCERHWQALGAPGGELAVANALHQPTQRTSIIA